MISVTIVIHPSNYPSRHLSQGRFRFVGFDTGHERSKGQGGARKKKKQKPTEGLSEENMAELTQKYFTCNMKIHKSLTGGSNGERMKVSGPKELVKFDSEESCGLVEMNLLKRCIIGCIMTETGVVRWKRAYEAKGLGFDSRVQCIIGCIMTEMGVMSNNQINVTSAEALIRKKAGDKAEMSIEVLKECAEKGEIFTDVRHKRTNQISEPTISNQRACAYDNVCAVEPEASRQLRWPL
uniref:Uncharacterized protein n=1 Tax=Timema tahoe TaxID=61484 RepID=A0A7R9IRM1_9NEOP|nr:unnamed protein product [Timema tahoe]